MQCPNCVQEKLQPIITKKGVEIDFCSNCSGIWLDDGEILLLTSQPESIQKKIEVALGRQTTSSKKSPKTGKTMSRITVFGDFNIDFCPDSKGLWLDKEELKSILDQEKHLNINVDRNVANHYQQKTLSDDEVRHKKIQAGLLLLPNLFLRSTVTLVGLYALVGIVVITAVEFLGAPLGTAVLLSLGAVILQFLLSPFIMDFTLRWLYKLEWKSPDELPSHLKNFVAEVCRKKRIKFPKFGIINDGAPQAFTYGHTPQNARIVISRGILELLDEGEIEAVVTHEIGHAVHWDMLLMTVANMVPLILYYIYRRLIESKSEGKGIYVAIGAYILYIISQYVVLWFSRTREYHADRFSGEMTGNPSLIASALVKIAYGLAGGDEKDEEDRSSELEAISAMGIFDSGAARSLAIAGASNNFNEVAPKEVKNKVNKDRLKGAMRWDLWNPWAKWYELNSTHPLVANRLRYLSDQAVHMGKEPYIVFDDVQPESYWDEFFVDFIINTIPALIIIVSVICYIVQPFFFPNADFTFLFGPIIFILGLALLFRFSFTYRGNSFIPLPIATLLKQVKVSAVRPVPCRIKGKIIGRGVPGYIFSEDFVIQDKTGIIFLDYRQPLAIFEFLFSILRAKDFHDEDVVVEGWYRRSPVPFVEIKNIVSSGRKSKSYCPILYKIVAISTTILGVMLTFFI